MIIFTSLRRRGNNFKTRHGDNAQDKILNSPFELDFILKNHSYVHVPLNFIVIAMKTSGDDFFKKAIAPSHINYPSHFLASIT